MTLRSRAALVSIVVLGLAGVAAWRFAPPADLRMAANVLFGFGLSHADAASLKSRLMVPPGYGVSLFAVDVPNARMLRVTDSGDLLVASPGAGKVFWLARDANGDGESDARRVLLDGLERPNGLELKDGYLYVAEESKVGRVRFDDATGEVRGDYVVVIHGLPPGGSHYKKTIRFGPDGLLYLTIGSSCNVCIEKDERRAAMLRYTPDGKFVDIYATGLRNSAGFDWRADGTLYATDNGRDLLGDDFPPCELNMIQQGGFYGWPFVNGDRVADPDLGAGRDAVIAASTPPVFAFRAHNAPLGIVFLRSDAQPQNMRGAALVALHGSWNRSRKDGYKVVALHFDGGTIRETDFLTGFLVDENVIGRPAELAEAADGTIYVSDDYANAVYRIVPGGTSTLQVGRATATTGPRVATATTGPRVATATDERLIARGATAFGKGGCQECHALGGDARDGRVMLGEALAQRYDATQLADYLAQPRPPMPPVADRDTRLALAAFLLERPQRAAPP